MPRQDKVEVLTIENTNKKQKSKKKYLLGFLLLLILLLTTIEFTTGTISGTVKRILEGNHVYTSEIPSVEINGNGYTSNTPGAWHIDKSARWTGRGKAEVVFDVNSIMKIDNNPADIILVMDVSGSMSGDKLTRAKEDAHELIDTLLTGSTNKAALITFETSSEIKSGLTNNKSAMLDLIDNLSDLGCTNYNAGLKNVLEVLTGYQKVANRDLILLFMTDGYPNVDTPNQIGTYEVIKDRYPYIKISGVQYEMGQDVIQEIREISDKQFIADRTNLSNVLFEASILPYTYEKFEIVDYIEDEYFYVGSVNDIKVPFGEVELLPDGTGQKIVWTLDGRHTGFSAQMKIKLTLKDAYLNNNTTTYYPTNKGEDITSKVEGESQNKIESSLTPVLKGDYKVIYDNNTPSGCTIQSTIPEEDHRPYDIVQKSSTQLSCSGYNFKGWEIVESGIKKINDEVFIMPEKDVHIRGIWTKQSIEKSMDGTVFVLKESTFASGQIVNEKMKQLANNSSSMTYSSTDNKITSIKRADSLPSGFTPTSRNTVSTSPSNVPIYIFFDNTTGTMYYYSEAYNIYLNSNSSYMFYRMQVLEDISGLSEVDASEATNMSYMFAYCSSLSNIDGASNWDTSSVTDMAAMFSNCTSLSYIDGASEWDTSKVITMRSMFYDCVNLSNIDDLNNWDTSSVTNMSYMFSTCLNLTNIDGASGWDTSKVTTMTYMFYQCNSLSNIDGASQWNTPSVTNMKSMFEGCSSLSDIDGAINWDMSSVTNMNSMFHTCTSLSDIDGASNWDTSSVTDMAAMFYYCSDLSNIDGASNWDTSSVTTMDSMFSNCSSLSNIDGASGWDTSSVTTMGPIFYECTSLSNIDGAINWDVSGITNMVSMFGYCTNLSNIDGASNWDTSNVTDMSSMFSHCSSLNDIDGASNWDTSSVTSMYLMFSDCSNLSDIDDLSAWDTSSVTHMRDMFDGCTNLSNIDGVSNWNMSTVIFIDNMFTGCSITDIDALSGWDTSSVTSMNRMFSNCSSLSDIDGASNWDTSKVIYMNGMFYNCGNLGNIDALSGWDTSNVISMYQMFYNCRNLSNINGASTWDTSSVTNMSQMFYLCINLSNIDGTSNWNTSSVTDISYMFQSCNKATGTFQILGNPRTYSRAFYNAATTSGSGITVNYSSATTNIDNIIAQKSSNSNVVKGIQVD